MATTHTERSLLTNFLLQPAPLPTLISLKTFTALFPHSQRSSPAIRALYRSLQIQRLRTIDEIKQNIDDETRRGIKQRKAFMRAIEKDKNESMGDEEIKLEESIFGPSSNLPVSKPHTLQSILPELNLATEALKTECQLLQEEENKIFDEIQDIIGGLSDLKYGKLENSHLRDQVVERCLRLERFCDDNARIDE